MGEDKGEDEKGKEYPSPYPSPAMPKAGSRSDKGERENMVK
jgi:hypothetical protein